MVRLQCKHNNKRLADTQTVNQQKMLSENTFLIAA